MGECTGDALGRNPHRDCSGPLAAVLAGSERPAPNLKDSHPLQDLTVLSGDWCFQSLVRTRVLQEDWPSFYVGE